MRRLGLLGSIITALLIIGITTVLYLYTSGYRLNRGEKKVIDLSKTGMISAKSIPEGATVYLDGTLTTATNDTVSSVKPGMHTLKIVKKGYVTWEKNIEVFEQLVTDITAVLISESPRLEPLTNTGAKYPSVSNSLSKLAYFSYDEEKPGIWVIPLNGAGLNIFRSTPSVALQDTKFTKYSLGKSIEWSPDEKNLLVEMPSSAFYLVDLDNGTAETTQSAPTVRASWTNILKNKRFTFIEKLNIPENIKQMAVSAKSIWAPDEKKFLYTVQNGNKLQYRVYDMETPLPVGEKAETQVFETNINDPQPKISWYSDSFHLIMVEGDIEKDKQGTISLIRIDGTNKTEIYNNTLYSDSVFSTPGGDKIIIVTSFKSGETTNLYTVGIR